jgi:uncharacterized membrane protein
LITKTGGENKMLKKTKNFNIFLILFFLLFSGFFLINFCFAQNGEKESDVTVSVPENSVNDLAEQIDATKKLIEQKRGELKEKKNLNLNIFLSFIVFLAVILFFSFIFDLFSKYKKKIERKTKRKVAKIKKKKRKAK